MNLIKIGIGIGAIRLTVKRSHAMRLVGAWLRTTTQKRKMSDWGEGPFDKGTLVEVRSDHLCSKFVREHFSVGTVWTAPGVEIAAACPRCEHVAMIGAGHQVEVNDKLWVVDEKNMRRLIDPNVEKDLSEQTKDKPRRKPRTRRREPVLVGSPDEDPKTRGD